MNRWKNIIRGNKNNTENHGNNNDSNTNNNNSSNNNSNNSSPSWQQHHLSLPFWRRSSGVTPGVSLTTDDGTTIQHPTASTRTHTTITEPSSHSNFHETRNSSPSIINFIDNHNNNQYDSVDNGDNDDEKKDDSSNHYCSGCSNRKGKGQNINHTRVHFFPSDFDNSEENHQDIQQEQLHPGEGAERRHSEETLVDEALGRQEARGRHVQFADHITESMSLIHGILNNRRRSSVWPTRDSIQMDEDGRRLSQHPQHRHRSNGDIHTGGGSVLGSLLRLEAQLQSVHQPHNTDHRFSIGHDNDQRRSSSQTIVNSNSPSPHAEKRATTAPSSIRSGHSGSLYAQSNISAPEMLHVKGEPSSPSSFGTFKKRPKEWLNSVTSSSHVVPSLEARKREITSRRKKHGSLMTTSSQFERISVEDRVRIAFEIANILQRQQFLYKLAKSLMLYGCPAHRIEYILRHVSATLKVIAEFIYLPNIMLMTFFDPETHTTETHFIRQTMGFDMHKLGEIYRLEKLVGHGEVTVDEALDFIDKVADDPKLYPTWMNPFIYAVISLCGSVMFFGGRWKEAGLSAGLAMFFAVYELFSERFWGFQPIWEITVCIFIGFVSRASTKFDFCFIPTAFSSFIVILPGYYIAIAIIELVSRQIISGIVRTGYAIIYSFLLGYGISTGSSIYRAIDPSVPMDTAPQCQMAANANSCIVSVSQYYHFLTVPLFAVAYCLLVRARPPRWPTIIFVSICGFVVNWLLSCIANSPSQVIQVVPAFAVGLIGNIFTKVTCKMSFDATLVAIFYLVPGSLGLKAAIGIFFSHEEGSYSSQGGSFALSMIEICIGIALGLCVANLIIYPKGAQRTPIMNM